MNLIKSLSFRAAASAFLAGAVQSVRDLFRRRQERREPIIRAKALPPRTREEARRAYWADLAERLGDPRLATGNRAYRRSRVRFRRGHKLAAKAAIW